MHSAFNSTKIFVLNDSSLQMLKMDTNLFYNFIFLYVLSSCNTLQDLKQSRIEELEVLLSKARSESAPLAEIQKLTEEKVKDHQALVSWYQEMFKPKSSRYTHCITPKHATN